MTEETKVRKIVIEINGDSLSISNESQHASVFELMAVLTSVIGMFNQKKEDKK